MSGARDEAIYHQAYLRDSILRLTASLRDSALAESWQSIIKHKINMAMETLK
ncbi:hypothetical protein [Helicobacter rodentium]|uniref:hypothetical protein n=1 Tax=Helicobacter rodentium TaxID=59617 RepID=UPI0023574859|nr:hypothetical protein [Helicobacter rodentium]